ncbi:MAG: ABC transporter ATP-binding protein [Ectothiorhodospiraceae bacterium]|nr:ABC transporter ATP-binding protein [Ectothiorhodospiraceae bacterium]
MNAIVELDNVERRFRGVHALRGLSLRLAPGEVLGLLGHNGAGKSTMMKLVLGVLAPSAGRVTVLGHDPRGNRARELRLQLGYLPENVSFYDSLTGREVLHYFTRLKRIVIAEANRLLEQVGLAHAADRRVRTYSKGMRQRLGLAQALLGQPRLLLLDEPPVGLDPMAGRDGYAMMEPLRTAGTSGILCAHVLPGVERHIDRVAILCQGRLLASGTIEALRDQAGLPLQIHVRGQGLNGALHQRLDDRGVTIESDGRNDSIRLKAPVAEKIAVLRALLEERDLNDISVESPTLDALYAHFDARGRDGGQAHA